ncbi:hypothetical protein R1flu_019421 [Riccia fluitans]|uniref:C3H1-type domain-containing protein n=1 Tax=Riccia fluitans TaxID=41844 RepID=A0ABD1ZIM4_9MARC
MLLEKGLDFHALRRGLKYTRAEQSTKRSRVRKRSAIRSLKVLLIFTMSRRQEICRDFQRGSCRYGARCKFLHQASGQQQQRQPQQKQNQRYGTSNYYGALGDNNYTGRSFSNQPSQLFTKEHKCEDFRICKDQIREDLQNEHPVFWRLTSYAHYKHLPSDIIGDVSPEELRASAYESAKQGLSLKDVAQREASMFAAKSAEFDALLKNPYKGPAAQVSASPFPSFSPSPVPQNTSTVMVFGQPLTLSNPTPAGSGFGQTPQPFGDTAPAGFGFGQPSGVVTFGSRPSPPAASPFGSQPTNKFQLSPFPSSALPAAQPNVFQQSPFTGTPFGVAQPSVVQPSPFGIYATPGSFAYPVASENLSPFGLSSSSGGVSSFPVPTAGFATPGTIVATNVTPPSSISNTAPATNMSMQDEEEAKWYKPVWKIGEIPEEEPPVQVRQ